MSQGSPLAAGIWFVVRRRPPMFKGGNYSAWRLKSRLHWRSLPAQAEDQSPRGDCARVGAVSIAIGRGSLNSCQRS